MSDQVQSGADGRTGNGTVLCVLSDEQRSEYRDELTGLEERGLSLVHLDDPDEALERAATLDPQLVIAGMELGPMEGLEFLAFFMKRYPEFERTVVVLPRKDDPFPPMAHSRNPSTGRSIADEVSIDRLDDLIPAAAPAPEQPAAPPVLQPSVVPPQKRPAWLIPLIALAAMAILGLAGFLVLSGSDESEASVEKAAAPPEPTAEPAAEPAAAEPAAAEPAAAEPAAAKSETRTETPKDPPTPKTGAAARAVDVSQAVALPFSFEKASGRPVLADDAKLTALIKALGASGSVVLGGHTSNEGDPGYNKKLGRRRAEAVREVLVKRGVPRGRIVVTSHGGDSPVASNATEEGRRRNRRVTVRVRP